MPDQQLDRQAAQRLASEWLGRRKPAASASLKADEFAATVLDYESALAAVEQRAVRAEEQLVALADAATRFRDHLSRNTFRDALTAASVAGGGQAVEPAADPRFPHHVAGCICPRFADIAPNLIADMCCPIHGIDGTTPGDIIVEPAAEDETA